MKSSFTLAAMATSITLVASASATCDPTILNTTTYYYPITDANTTVFDVARITKRGVCDIGRQNLMADVTIRPNVGETFIIPGEVCYPDNTSCLLSGNATNTCIVGGPRLYYTVNGDTYEKVALRLNITVDALVGDMGTVGGTKPTDELPVGRFIKVPLCENTTCVIRPYSFSWGVYKDLAEEFGTTVGQIMMLSPTYNYSSLAFTPGGTFPPINILTNCTQPGKNVTVLD
ncbi:hypothetical protein ANOM_000004 [Aspergillus nomiae NRRL 13137]|uniref:LysM domain-containing protein n=1 Tax=Aspergillus nomiae NRRL (strain ATCC 15546 / NRRL 13137 / CBS 260.88 / M93) TaxID=1509407 RepID=A0A0L1JIH4_ASPN3|nr:uncharacterized protein ANOM_000004 [Aspergillus nomiae NRRL 13137]KNG91507.1 hypothetical protein ANOM_000004 [Aspergillus nomiae NRRL 13137]